MAKGSEPGVTAIAGSLGTRLRLDDQAVACRNFLRTHRIGWHQVRWFTDGVAGSQDDRQWVLRIVLNNGLEINCRATATREPDPETLAGIRRAAARHRVPVVLTGTIPRQGQPHTAGLYVDPGGKLGLREWTGTEWSPFLRVDPASSGPGEENGPETVWSPLPEAEQQRQWEEAHARARQAKIRLVAWLTVTAVATVAMLAVLIYTTSHPKTNLWWYSSGWCLVACIAWGPVFAWSNHRGKRTASRAASVAAQLVRAADTAASPLDD